MKQYLNCFLLSVCLILVETSVCSSQQPLKAIQGFINIEGAPANGVKVTPKNFNAAPQFTRDGNFAFRGAFQVGETYLFSFEKPGYKPVSEKELHPDKVGYLGTLDMAKEPAKDQKPTKVYTPFSDGREAFKVLILPFDPFSTCKNTDQYCLDNIRDRFIKINETSKFKVSIKVDERFNTDYPMTFDSAKAVGIWYNADMVIWGDYEERCNWDSSLFNLKFVTFGGVEEEMFSNKLEDNGKKKISSYRSIVDEGTLTGDVEDVIAWSVGIRHLNKTEYDAALASFQKIAIKPRPEFAIVYCLKGWCLSKKKMYHEAFLNYDSATTLNSRLPLIYVCRGLLFREQLNYKQSLVEFERAKYLDKNCIEALLQLSILQDQQGDLQKAAEYLQLAEHADSIERVNIRDLYENRLVFMRAQVPEFQAIDFFNTGQLMEQTGEYQKAIQFYIKSVEISPDHFDSWAGIGRCFDAIEDTENAIRYYLKALAISPNDYSTLSSLSYIYSKKKDYEKALEYYKRAVAVNKEHDGAWHNLGAIYEKMNRNKEAAECRRKAAELDPDNYQHWCCLGIVESKLEHHDEAINCFQKCLKIMPTHFDALNNLAGEYYSKSNWEASLQCYQKVVELKPGYWLGHQFMGYIYMELNKPELAIPSLETCINIQPNDIDNRLFIAQLYVTIGQIELGNTHFLYAMNADSTNYKAWLLKCLIDHKVANSKDVSYDLVQVRKYMPSDYRSLLEFGQILNQIDEKEAALEIWGKALKLNPAGWEAWYSQALVLHDLIGNGHNQSEVIECLNQVVKIVPENIDTWDRLSLLYYQAGNKEQAINCLQKKLELQPDNFEDWNLLVYTYFEIKQPQKALDYLNRSAVKMPQNIYIPLTLGDVYYELGEKDKCLEYLKKAVKIDSTNILPWKRLGTYYHLFGKTDLSINAFKQAIKLRPDDIESWASLIQVYHESGRENDVKAGWDHVFSLNPKNVDDLYGLFETSTKIGDDSISLNLCKKILDTNPKDEKALFNMGYMSFQQGKIQEAFDFLNKSIQINPNLPESFALRGLFQLTNHNFEESKKDLEKSIQLGNQNGQTFAMLAVTHGHLGEDELFYKYIELSITKTPPFPLKEAAASDLIPAKYISEARFQQILARAKE